MTSDKIIELAREAGITLDREGQWCNEQSVKRFASLVALAVAEREACSHTVDDPVAWEWQRPIVGSQGETIGYDQPQITRTKDFLPWWPHCGLYRQPR